MPLAATACLLASTATCAHHSYTEFASEQIVDIEGTLVETSWQNPHSHLVVRVRDAAQRDVKWDIETGPLNALVRRQVPLEVYKVGDTVKVSGWPSKRTTARMYATNLVSSSGYEVVLQPTNPRGLGAVASLAERGPTPAQGADTRAAATLFRVWSSDPDADPETRTGFLTRAQVSLSDAAKRAVAAFDAVTQTTTDGCAPKAFPILMGQPFPIEFIDRGDTILLRLEEYDAVRTIHLASAPTTARQRSPLGYSAGRWEGDTLIVTTDAIDAPYFNSSGIPLGSNTHAEERFSVSGDGRRLAYTLTVTEPATFVEPAKAQRAWLARDGERLLPYDCKVPSRR
jgi:hypothetical protein